MFGHPYFWRHFGAIVVGGACTALGVLVPPLAPLAIPGGALLVAAGTKLLEGDGSRHEETTPAERPSKKGP